MNPLIAPFANLACGGEDPVHGPFGREVAALVEEGGIGLGRGSVDEALAVEEIEDGRLLDLRERPWWAWSWRGRPEPRLSVTPVVGRPRYREGGAGGAGAHDRGELVDGGCDHRSGLCSALSRVSSRKSADTFPWTAITFSARLSRA